MTAAHQAAENIRAAYGYSGGPDGSQYLPNSYASVRTQYQDAGSAAAQAYRLAAQQGAARLAAQRPQIQADYDDLARQAYINYMKEKRDLPETLGRLGLQGQGTAETTAAAQSADYQNNLLAGERARQNALLGLENQIQDVYLTGDLKSAQAQAQALLEMAQGYPDYLLSQQKLEQDAQLRQLQLQSQGGKPTSSVAALSTEAAGEPNPKRLYPPAGRSQSLGRIRRFFWIRRSGLQRRSN